MQKTPKHMLKKNHNNTAREQLEAVLLRVTPQRLAILKILHDAQQPLPIDEIEKKVGNKANYVTLYRVLKQFVEAGLIYQTDFRSGRAYFEYQKPGHHHHHITCTTCGAREATEDCHETKDEYAHVTCRSQMFNTITAHSLEFFGICKRCT